MTDQLSINLWGIQAQATGLAAVGALTYEVGYDAALRLMHRLDPPDAIFFASDIMAFGGIDALRSDGIRYSE
jgi:DNA-binding LacI/PurR family transcriptional regulator